MKPRLNSKQPQTCGNLCSDLLGFYFLPGVIILSWQLDFVPIFVPLQDLVLIQSPYDYVHRMGSSSRVQKHNDAKTASARCNKEQSVSHLCDSDWVQLVGDYRQKNMLNWPTHP